MRESTATALAHPNIAFIKYWGNRDDSLRLPQNGSISMNLAGLHAHTRVSFNQKYDRDIFILNDQPQHGKSLDRVSEFLSLVRQIGKSNSYAKVESANNFPVGAGIASSAAAFAALALASTAALGLNLTEQQLSALARRGSGSACRSVPAGFVEWLPGTDDSDSYAVTMESENHWDLTDCIAVVKESHKPIGSSEGHSLAKTSILQPARVTTAANRLDMCRNAIHDRDFDALAAVVEMDSSLMHAVMMTSSPPLYYWEPASIQIMKAVQEWRINGIPACFTLDAGPNVHVICPGSTTAEICRRLGQIPGVNQVLTAHAGGGVHLTNED